VQGQFCLGNCLLYGTGIEKDDQAAIVWLKKAADAGFPPAIKTLNQIKKKRNLKCRKPT
jgi:TPR repeat protein